MLQNSTVCYFEEVTKSTHFTEKVNFSYSSFSGLLLRKNPREALNQCFPNPTPKSLVWADIEALLLAVGCEIIEGDGSRVRFIKDDVIGYFHRPHPKKEAAPYQVRDAKTFLTKLGVQP